MVNSTKRAKTIDCMMFNNNKSMMKELHEGPSRGHFAMEIMQKKILDVGYWWLIMYKHY
jgi:hypothetical protein